MLRTVNIDGKTFVYEFERKNIKNINLRVRRNGSVYLSAPIKISERRISEFILMNKDFIFGAKKRAAQYEKARIAKESFDDGSEKILFGNKFYIKAVENDKPSVRLQENTVFLCLKDFQSPDKRKKLFESWALEIFKEKLFDICREAYKEFEIYGVLFPEIKVRKMVSRWGSCNASKRILTFNTRLLEYPENCIKSVVYHEFCHFIYQNHSKAFYSLLSKHFPEWKECRKILNDG